jgi:hypothetical protein
VILGFLVELIAVISLIFAGLMTQSVSRQSREERKLPIAQ